MNWSRHKYAPFYLCLLSFAESSFFPIPPDFMLAPMVLAKPERAWWYAFITTCSSVLGALLGYVIGIFFLSLIYPVIVHFGYAATYHQIGIWFEKWNFWVMIFAGFAIIPYKLFTIAAGAMHISLLPFLIGSVIGRGGRFYLVTGILVWKGAVMEQLLLRYMEKIGWIVVIGGLLLYGAVKLG